MKTNLCCRLPGLLAATLLVPFTHLNAQNCGPANSIYGMAGTDQRTLVSIDTLNGTATNIGDVFGGGNAAADPTKQTSAIAVDPITGIIWFTSRTPGNIYSYTPGAANPYGATTAVFGVSGNINKAAYNPADSNIYFHISNTLYRFKTSTPNVAPVSIGNLGISGLSTTDASYGGGDIAFDSLGNLTGVFSSLNALAVFPANYDANGNYLGLNLSQGVILANFSSAPSSVAFLPSGDYLVGSNSLGVVRVNTTTGAQTTLSAFGASDYASCIAPKPHMVVTQTATGSCTAANQVTLTFTIVVRNNGKFAAINSRIFDQLPAGLTITGATLNGTAIPGANNTLFQTGNGPLISSAGAAAFQNGVIERGDSAKVVITATGIPGMYSNQAGISYTGVETLNLPNDRVPSDDPSTTTANDPTTITAGCSSLTGTVFNDANGMTDNLVNGTGTGTPGGTAVYINLVNAGGIVIASVPVNANGTYTISNIPNGSYTAQLSTLRGTAGQAAPAQQLPAGWVNTGESFGGVNDPAIGDGLPLTVNGNSTNANLGIERLPESYPVTRSITGAPALTNLGTQPLQGSDPEDLPAQGSWSGRTIVIDTLPTNGYILKYNGTTVVAGNPIANYNPALLTIEPGASSGGTATTTFKYSTVDAAGKKDPTPAAYRINWSIALPVQLRSFSGRAAKDCSVLLNWSTEKEERLAHFAVQRSKDGVHFETIALQSPKGSNSDYQYTDEQSGAAVSYYRLYIKDQDLGETYSAVVPVGTTCSTAIAVFPNPANDKVVISGLSDQTELKVTNVPGAIVLQTMLNKGQTALDISALAAGTYYFVFTTGGQVQTFKVLKK